MNITPHLLRVHNYHLDGYGHVNNARYLEFLEQARWHYFRELNLHDILRQIQLVVAHIDIAYRHAAVHDDVLQIDTEMLSVQSRQIVLRQVIRISGSLKIAAQATITLMPTQQGKVFRLPEHLIESFNQLIKKENI